MRQDSRNWVTLGGEKLFHVHWEPLTVCKEPELGFSHAFCSANTWLL